MNAALILQSRLAREQCEGRVIQLNSGVYQEDPFDNGRLLDETVATRIGRPLPARIEGIPVRQLVGSLHALTGIAFNRTPQGTEVARLVFHYADGDPASLPLITGQNIDGFYGGGNELDRFVWARRNEDAPYFSRLMEAVWHNPHPDRIVESMDFISTEQAAGPFLIAATVAPPLANPLTR